MRAGETEKHRQLKALALGWAQTHGFPIAGLEVRVPRSGYRADVAASARGPSGVTAVFECKQARSDLLRDTHCLEHTRARLLELSRRKCDLEALLSVHRPDLRKGESLFPEYDAWNFDQLEHHGYRTLLGEIAQLQERARGGTKFARMFRYRSADLLYLVCEDDIYAAAEIPAGWGLLVRKGDELALRRPPVALECPMEQRYALLEAIALAGTRVCNRVAGVVPPLRAPTALKS